LLRSIINGFLIAVLTGILWTACSDPLSEEDEKHTVLMLIEGSMPQGSYVKFWNGKNKEDQYVPAGTYWVRLYTTEFTFQQPMKVLDGGTGRSNFAEDFYEGDPAATLTLLESVEPDTFYVEDGTNIRFTLGTATSLRLSIRDKE